MREQLTTGEAREAIIVLFPEGLRFKVGPGYWKIEGAASVPTIHDPDGARSSDGDGRDQHSGVKMEVPVSAFSRALASLLELDGRTVPVTHDEAVLFCAAVAAPWLRFGLGATADETPADRAALTACAEDFARDFDLWTAYRQARLEVRPPGEKPVRFYIDPELGEAVPPGAVFPAATFALVTAWNPGSGEPRPGDRANRRANERLAAHLDARMAARLPAVNAPGTRFAEESFCVLGIELEDAFRLGEAFGQRAIYYVDRGTPHLVARRRGRIVSWVGRIRWTR
jgi:hypothetical protein